VNFDYSEEQQLLAESVRRFVARDYAFENRKKILASPSGMSDTVWATFAEMGLLALPLPADAGAAIVFVGLADPWKPFAGMAGLRKIERVEIVPLDVTDTESVTELAEQNGARIDIVVNTAEHIRAGGVVDRHGLTIAREEIDVRYLGLLRLAQAFGPILRSRGADGVNSAAAFVNLLSVHALMNWPAYGSYSATEAACLSAAQCMRAELRPGGVKVVNVFFGPLETEWFQTVPPPKVTPAALADAVVRALQRGLEDVFVGDVAEDIRQRLAVNPKALEREMAN